MSTSNSLTPTSKKNEAKKKSHPSKLDIEKIVPLNFRVPAGFKRDFKIAAANYGITQSELLQRTFEAWQRKDD